MLVDGCGLTRGRTAVIAGGLANSLGDFEAALSWGLDLVNHRTLNAHGPVLSKCSNALARLAGYSITSSASASSLRGMSSLSALAVLRLMTNSSLVDCITGRSAGFSPLRIRPV